MAGTVELQRLIVRLSGDPSGYIKMLKDAQKSAKAVGSFMTKYLTLPIIGVGTLAVREFAKFDQAMIESTSIMSASADQMQRMRDTALELSKVSTQGPDEMARSYFYLASAGLNAEQAIAALPAVTSFATAGAFDMARATDLLTDAQSALGLTSKNTAENLHNMTRVSDVLVKANTLANASVEQFSIALTSKAGASLKMFNKDVEEGVAVLAAMADQGIKAELAGNNFSRVMLLLAKASQDNEAQFRKFGFSVFDAQGKMRNMADIIENLEQVLHGMSDEQKTAIMSALGFEARIQGAILPIIGTSKAIRRYEEELRKAGGTTRDVADKQLKSFSNQIKILWNNIRVAAIGIGELLAPTILSLNEKIKSAAVYWNELSDGMKKFVVFTGVTVAAVGPILLIFAKMATMLALVTGSATALGITLKLALVGAYAALAVVAYQFGKRMAESLPAVRAVREEMERMNAEHKHSLDLIAERHKVAIGRVLEADTPETKKSVLDKEIRNALRLVNLYGEEVQEAHNEQIRLEQSWIRLQSTVDRANQQMEEATARRENAEKNLNDLIEMRKALQEEDAVAAAEAANEAFELIESIEEYNKKLRESYATLGWTTEQTELWKLQQAGATKEMLAEATALERMLRAAEKRKDMFEEGKNMVERYLTPFQKLRKEHAELLQLRRMGAIDQGTYHRGNMQLIEEYKNEMDALRKKGVIEITVDTSAIRGGTAEFANMLAAVRPEARFSYEGRRDQKSFLKMEAHLERLVRLEEEKRGQIIQLGVADL